jgi:S-ribosylhomocysteine lyase LuxS involved in autoinducer biosynthesis
MAGGSSGKGMSDRILRITSIQKNSIKEPYLNILMKRLISKDILFIKMEIKLRNQDEVAFNDVTMHSLLHCYTRGFNERFKSHEDLHFLGIGHNGSSTGFHLSFYWDAGPVDSIKIYDIVNEEFSIISRIILNYEDIPNINYVDCSRPFDHTHIDVVKDIVKSYTGKLKIIISEET